MSERHPWPHVGAALRYLFDPERVACDASPLGRMGESYRGEPGVLAGLDGAATAGTAIAMLTGNLSALQLAVLACRYSPPSERCACGAPCCSGRRPAARWAGVIRVVALEAMTQALDGCNAHLLYVQAVLAREYGDRHMVNLTDVGADLGMSLGTCTAHRRKVLSWLQRTAVPPRWRADGAAIPAVPMGVELAAVDDASDVLRGGGFIP